jgi:hypothetical protein
MGRSELPPVSILEMILEGPKGYFGRRGQMQDAQWLQQQAQQQQGAYAQNLIKTPEWNTAMSNPYDRQAQGGLWALTQGGPGNIPTQGGNWLQDVISGSYGREQATFEDALQKSRIKMGTDEALRLEQGKVDIASKQMQALQEQVFGTDPQTGLTNQQSQFLRTQQYNMLAEKTGMQKTPEGYAIGTLPGSNEPAFVPAYGGKPWQEMMGKLSPLQAMNGAVDELMDLDKSGSSDTGRRQQLIATIQDQIRVGSNMGSLDAGALEQMGKYINDYGATTGYGALPVGSKNYATAQEKLRGLKISTTQKIADWTRTYVQDPRQMGDPYAYTRPADKVPLPSQTADEAVRKLKPPPNASQPAPSSKVNRGPLPAGTAPLLDDSGAGRDTGMRARGRGGR